MRYDGLPMKKWIAFLILVGALFRFASSAEAQSFATQAQGFGVAENIVLDATDVPNGSVVVHQQGSYRLSSEPYSKDLVGVISLQPAIEFVPTEPIEGSYPFVQSGASEVLVNGEGGPIKSGDLLTSSSTPGVAMKATKSGFVLGVAQGDFDPSSPLQTGLVPLLIDIRFAFSDDAPQSERVVSRLMSIVSLNAISFTEEPVKSLKYTAAAFTVILSLGISFLTFGRVSYKGVEAIGRNPLAKSSITFSVILNTLLALGLAAAGMVAAYMIVRW
jgi:hypothetical protein